MDATARRDKICEGVEKNGLVTRSESKHCMTDALGSVST